MKTQKVSTLGFWALVTFTFASLSTAACSNTQEKDRHTDVSSHVEDAQEGEHEMNTAYGLEVSVGAGLSVIVLVNDVPFKPKEAGSSGVLSLPINGEVIPGKNKVEVLIGTKTIKPDDEGTTILPGLPDDPSLTVDLQKDIAEEPSPGVYATTVESLKVHDWEPELTNGKPVFPQKLEFSFDAPANYTSPSWFSAQEQDVSDIQDNLIQAYRDIITKLQARDAESVANMRKLAYRDAAQAYPLGGSEEARLERGLNRIARRLSQPNLTVPDLLEPVECKSYADGRLFECLAADGKPVVRLQPPGRDPIYYKFRFSLIDGKLRVVR